MNSVSKVKERKRKKEGEVGRERKWIPRPRVGALSPFNFIHSFIQLSTLFVSRQCVWERSLASFFRSFSFLPQTYTHYSCLLVFQCGSTLWIPLLHTHRKRASTLFQAKEREKEKERKLSSIQLFFHPTLSKTHSLKEGRVWERKEGRPERRRSQPANRAHPSPCKPNKPSFLSLTHSF